MPSPNSKKNTSVLKFDDLKVIGRIIAQNWYVPIIAVIIFYFIGYFMAYREYETYEVQAQLLLKSNDQYYKNNLISDADNFYGGVSASYLDNSNETRVIKSYDLIEKVVNKLKDRLQVSYFIVGRVRTTEVFSGMPFTVQVNSINNELYDEPFSIKILNKKAYEISYKEGDKEIKMAGIFGKELITLKYNILIENNGLTSETNYVQYEFRIHKVASLISRFQGSLNVENPDYTNILKLSVEDNLIERSKLFLDTLAKVYIDNTLKTRVELNERTLQYIDKQLSEISQVLKFFEDTMQRYKSNKGILDLDNEERDNFEKLSDLDKQRSQLKLQVAALNDLENYIIEDKDPQFLPPSAFINNNDAFLVKEATQLYNLQMQLIETRNTSKEKNYAITHLEDNIKKTKQDILVYINNARTATKKVIENLTSEIDTYVANIKSIPEKQRDLLGIQRKLSVNEGLYNFLLQKRANTYIAKASIIPETKVIESPRVTGKINPDKKKILLQYISIGVILSIFIILIRFFFFTTIQSIPELKEITDTPIIGDILYIKDAKPTGITIDEDTKSQVAENFRTLRTNLQYLNTNVGSKTVLITSNAPGEGKTFCSLNLAAILAKGDKKVLLIELDLHKPRVQKALQMNAEKGISTIVVKQNTIQECIRPSNIEKLDVLLSGPIPPNPSEMILSEELKQILQYAKANYDYIIIDSPPAGLISDSIYLMQFADISLFVLNAKYARKRIISFIDELVSTNKISHFAYVLNGVKRKRFNYYYNGYSYGYGYTYGYTRK